MELSSGSSRREVPRWEPDLPVWWRRRTATPRRRRARSHSLADCQAEESFSSPPKRVLMLSRMRRAMSSRWSSTRSWPRREWREGTGRAWRSALMRKTREGEPGCGDDVAEAFLHGVGLHLAVDVDDAAGGGGLPAEETAAGGDGVGLALPWDHQEPVWELRIGEHRVFYDVDEPARRVLVRAIRRKPPQRTTEEIL